MEENPIESPWQKQLKFRGFRLLGWALPLMLLALFASSLVPRTPPETLVERDWGTNAYVNGRMETPKRKADELPMLVELRGPLPMPKPQTISLRFKGLDGSVDVKRQWPLKPRLQAGEWIAQFVTPVPAGQKVAYLLRWKGDFPKGMQLKLISDPERSINKYLRLAEIAFYPSLALCLLAGVMIVFPHIFK